MKNSYSRIASIGIFAGTVLEVAKKELIEGSASKELDAEVMADLDEFST